MSTTEPAEHQPTAREACGATIAASEFLPGVWKNHQHFCSEVRGHGFDDTEHRCRCGAAWTHAQPAPVASAGGRLSEEEYALGVDVHDDGPDAPPTGHWFSLPAVNRILAVRLAAAEQRLAAVRALDVGHSTPCTHPDEPCVCSVPLFDLRAALGDASPDERSK